MACKYVRVQLSVFDMLVMFGQLFARQGFGFTLAAFIPTHPIALNGFSLVNPNLSHNIYCIVNMGVQIKRESGPGGRQISTILETWHKTPKILASQDSVLEAVI